MKAPHGEPGLHYLCKSYKKFFCHINKYMRAMLKVMENDLLVSCIMDVFDGPLVIKRDWIKLLSVEKKDH